MPYWYKLIDYWVNVRGRNGLTIPFLIGVEIEFIDPSIEVNETLITDLIEEIAASDMEMVASLFGCGQVREFVIGLDDRGGYGNELTFYSETKEPTLTVPSGLFKKETSLNEVIAFLTEKYWPNVKNGEYSKNWDAAAKKWVWGPFTPEDIEFIKKALA